MSFFDDVTSFFGGGEKQEEGPITVPVAGADANPNDPAVLNAQAAYSIACEHEDAVNAREKGETQLAEGRQSADWMAKSEAATAEAENARAQADGAKTKIQGGTLYEDEVEALKAKAANAEWKAKCLKDFHTFARNNPVQNYMDKAFLAEQKHAGLARMNAQMAIDAAKRAAPKAAAH